MSNSSSPVIVMPQPKIGARIRQLPVGIPRGWHTNAVACRPGSTENGTSCGGQSIHCCNGGFWRAEARINRGSTASQSSHRCSGYRGIHCAAGSTAKIGTCVCQQRIGTKRGSHVNAAPKLPHNRKQDRRRSPAKRAQPLPRVRRSKLTSRSPDRLLKFNPQFQRCLFRRTGIPRLKQGLALP